MIWSTTTSSTERRSTDAIRGFVYDVHSGRLDEVEI
jgi:hypothetical protein